MGWNLVLLQREKEKEEGEKERKEEGVAEIKVLPAVTSHTAAQQISSIIMWN